MSKQLCDKKSDYQLSAVMDALTKITVLIFESVLQERIVIIVEYYNCSDIFKLANFFFAGPQELQDSMAGASVGGSTPEWRPGTPCVVTALIFSHALPLDGCMISHDFAVPFAKFLIAPAVLSLSIAPAVLSLSNAPIVLLNSMWLTDCASRCSFGSFEDRRYTCMASRHPWTGDVARDHEKQWQRCPRNSTCHGQVDWSEARHT